MGNPYAIRVIDASNPRENLQKAANGLRNTSPALSQLVDKLHQHGQDLTAHRAQTDEHGAYLYNITASIKNHLSRRIEDEPTSLNEIQDSEALARLVTQCFTDLRTTSKHYRNSIPNRQKSWNTKSLRQLV